MGCDMHLHVEVKVNGQWHHYGAYQPRRDYPVFAILAGVRGREDTQSISSPRGLPEDVTYLTRFHYDRRYAEWHSESWLDLEELGPLVQFMEERTPGVFDPVEKWAMGLPVWTDGYDSLYLFQSSWLKVPEGVEEVRWVFWFDN